MPELRGGGPLTSPIFGRSVNPIPIGEGRLSPPITTGTSNVLHLPASLEKIKGRLFHLSNTIWVSKILKNKLVWQTEINFVLIMVSYFYGFETIS